MIMLYLVKRPNPVGRFVKWLDELQEFDFAFMMEHSMCATLADLLIGKEMIEEVEEQIKIGGKKQAEIQSAAALRRREE